MEWVKNNKYKNVYEKTRSFGKYKFKLEVVVENNIASIAVSSGRKRRQLVVFEQKEEKTLVGLKPLLWVKEEIYNLHSLFDDDFKVLIAWSDNRRRDIYARSLKDFSFQTYEGKKVLIKKFKNAKRSKTQ